MPEDGVITLDQFSVFLWRCLGVLTSDDDIG